MVSRNIYIQLIIRIVVISLTALLTASFYFKERYLLSGFLLFLLGIQTYVLIQYINQTNRKIAYFFDAIKNEDFTLRFPEKLSVKSLEELNHSLNMLNGMIQDIHLKKQAQEHYYQEIIRQAAIGILTINSKGHILFANGTVEKLLNYHPLNHVKQFNQIDAKLYALFADLEPFDGKVFQLSNERENSQLALKATAINVDGEALLLVTVQDIHKELDEKETDSWVRLIRVLTHEIMNTITPITSISESILKYFKNKNEPVALSDVRQDHIVNTAKGLEVIKEQGGNLMDFVQSYRSFLSVPKPDKKLVPVMDLLDKVKLLMTPDNVQEMNEIAVEVKPEGLSLFIDEKQITQNLINLVKNALQSLKGQENGKVRIQAGETGKGQKYLTVWDNGPGIPADLIDEIFVPFFTTKDSGTGIGLSLSKQIMHLHGGGMKVHSTSESGTAFTMLF